MFYLTHLNQLDKAAAKARIVKPTVRMIQFGLYVVKGSTGATYTVRCERSQETGKRIVACDCPATKKDGVVCYHAASALELHCTIAKHRVAA